MTDSHSSCRKVINASWHQLLLLISMAELTHASGAPTVYFTMRSEQHAAGSGIGTFRLNIHVHRNHLGGRQPHNSARCDHSVAMQEPVPKMCHMVRNTFQPYVFGTFLANSGVI